MLNNLKFLRNIKVNDFILSSGILLSMIFPSMIGIFLFERDFFEYGIVTVLFTCLSFGMVTFGICLNGVMMIVRDKLEPDSDSKISELKKLMPSAIAYNLISYCLFFVFFVLVFGNLDDKVRGISDRFPFTFFLYILGIIIFNMVIMLIANWMNKRSGFNGKSIHPPNDGQDSVVDSEY